jgi:hypothetical protein
VHPVGRERQSRRAHQRGDASGLRRPADLDRDRWAPVLQAPAERTFQLQLEACDLGMVLPVLRAVEGLEGGQVQGVDLEQCFERVASWPPSWCGAPATW